MISFLEILATSVAIVYGLGAAVRAVRNRAIRRYWRRQRPQERIQQIRVKRRCWALLPYATRPEQLVWSEVTLSDGRTREVQTLSCGLVEDVITEEQLPWFTTVWPA